MESDYTIHGRCRDGEPLRIVIPCWRLHGETVVRGEAEPMAPATMKSLAGSTRGHPSPPAPSVADWRVPGAEPEGLSLAPER
jgi:hypothetical protein